MPDEGWAKAPGELGGPLEGRKIVGPQQGFGPLWQKSYRIEIPGHSPEEVVGEWKAHFGEFWPVHSKFNAPLAGIRPGEIGMITTMQALSTGVLVMYADETSFAFITPEGHPFASWITFSATTVGESTVAGVDLLVRPSEPIWDLAFSLGAGKGEDLMWRGVLKRLARRFGSDHEPVEHHSKVDPKRIWANAGNWRNNALFFRRARA